ncbi:MAG: radical SAM protein [Gemmatimonadetes bacterium]|nr:radical SAM protein [Gemmatimonadota bacterium]
MATLILKATERCNSNCYYCDVVRKLGTGLSMPLDVLEAVFVRVGEYLRQRRDEHIEILWHGGEPLLLGPGYFATARELQRRHCAGTEDRIAHNIQTNLTRMNEAFVPVFRDLGITAVGTSYDPEPHMRGPGSQIDSDRYNARFMRGLRVLEECGFGWGVIYVVTRKSLRDPVGVFRFLTNLHLTGGINFNPVLIYDQDRQDVAITPAEFVDFLGAIFECWWPRRARYPEVEPFRSLVANIIDGRVALSCVDSGRCTYHHVNVAPNGDTSQCGRSADWALLSYGNIKERPLEAILADEQRGALERRVRYLRDTECGGCRFWSLCHGGCPLDAYAAHQDFMHKTNWCAAKSGFIERYFEPITGTRYSPPPPPAADTPEVAVA